MKKTILVFGTVLALAGLLTGCATVQTHPADLERTSESRMERMPDGVEGKVPVVIFAHGCAGLYAGDTSTWARNLTRAGYAVEAPDSFARPGRTSNCDPGTLSGGRNPQAHDMRIEEIEFASARVLELPWVDQGRIFLMGHSEGDIAAARYSKSGFAGVVISGWTCTSRGRGWEWLGGLWTPKGVPVLSVNFETDPWYERTNMKGSCGTLMGKGSRALTLHGSGHATSGDQEAVQAVVEFLARNKP